MKNIVLIGMPGTGKSTVGVILAKQLGYGFIDTDILLAQKTGRTLPQILREDGVAGFLKLEGRVGAAISTTACVIATGGSMVLSDAAMENLLRNSVIIWLDTPLDLLERRLKNSRISRGVAAEGDTSVAEIYARREPYYEKYAHIKIACADGIENVVADIIKAL